MLRQHHVPCRLRAIRSIPRRARGGFEAIAARHRHLNHAQGHAAFAAELSAKPRPRRRMRTQLMVHMQRRKTPSVTRRALSQNIQQYHRINAAAQAHAQRLARRDPRGDYLFHLVRQNQRFQLSH